MGTTALPPEKRRASDDCGNPNPEVLCKGMFCDTCAAKRFQLREEKDGKTSITTKHEDGRQDVEIRVNRLNIENRTPEDDIAEKAIIEAMTKKDVRVLVLHKPTNENATFVCKLPQVRERAEAVVKAHMFRTVKPKAHEEAGMFEILKGDYVIVEYDADQIRISSL